MEYLASSNTDEKYCVPLYTQEEKRQYELTAYGDWKNNNLLLVEAIEQSIRFSVDTCLKQPNWENKRIVSSLIETLTTLSENYIEDKWRAYVNEKEKDRSPRTLATPKA
jgi:hypothetical protein